MTNIRHSLNKKIQELELLQQQKVEAEAKQEEAEQLRQASIDALAIMQQAATLSQEHLAKHLSSIVTHAIQTVIKKDYTFVCEFVERRGATEADMFLTKDGKRFEILDGTGGGLADVISFSLKVAYLLLSSNSKVLVIDEVSRHINSPEQRENFAAVVKKLSQEFDIQLILNTTIPELESIADSIVTLTPAKGGGVNVTQN